MTLASRANMEAMAGSRSTPASTDREPEFDAIADELYALPPGDFAAARDEYVRKARAEGRQALARELAQLRRPTLSAWLINLLWRDQRDVMEQLFELADALRRAQAQAAGGELRTLTDQRRELEAALLRRASELADEHGVKLTDTVAREAQEVRRRVERYRGNRASAVVRGRTAIVVDDGLATGLSDLAAVRAMRAAGASSVCESRSCRRGAHGPAGQAGVVRGLWCAAGGAGGRGSTSSSKEGGRTEGG